MKRYYYYYSAESDEIYEFDQRMEFKSYLKGLGAESDDLVSEDQDSWEKPIEWLKRNSKKRKITTRSKARTQSKSSTRVRRQPEKQGSHKGLKICLSLIFLIALSGAAYFLLPQEMEVELQGEQAEFELRNSQKLSKNLIALAGEPLAKAEQWKLLNQAQGFSLKVASCEMVFSEGCRIKKMTDLIKNEQISIPHMGDGVFTVKVKGAGGAYSDVVLNKIRKEGEHLLIGNEQLCLSFKLEAKEDYLVLRMNDFSARDGVELMSCELKFNSKIKPSLIPLDYMVQHKSHGPSHRMIWPWLWGRNEVNPLGGFALYFPQNDRHHDEVLLDIWVNEALPGPSLEGEWTESLARKWLKDWGTKFEDQSTMILQAEDPKELYNLTDYAISMGMKKIYLHTDTWRGEYWPHKNSFLHINKDVFPQGEKSLQEYSQHLKSKGVLLALHSVSGAIGNFDPDYLGENFSSKLATWNEAVLHLPVDEKDRDMTIKVSKGAQIPKAVAGHEWFAPKSNYSWLDLKCFRIGEEFVFPREIIDNKNGTWLLKDCRRGGINTKVTHHAKGISTKAFYRPYGQSFTAGIDNGMLEELVARIANFYNENEITHLELDGLEIHMSKPWGSQKFSWLLNQKINHQYMSNTSGGKPLPFQVEYWFKSSSKVMANHPTGGVAGGDGVPLITHNSKRLATNPYEIHIKPTQRLGQKGKTVNFMRPTPMFGVSEIELKNHGLSRYIADQVKAWKKALNSATNGYQSKAKGLPEQFTSPLSYAVNQRAFSELIRPSDHGRAFEKFTLMSTDKTTNWGWGQEYGPLVPKIYFQSNDSKSVKLKNPYSAQIPEFVLRIMPSFAQSDKAFDGVKSHQELQQKTKEIVESYHTGAGTTHSNHPLSQSYQVWAPDLVQNQQEKKGSYLLKREFVVDELSKVNLASFYFHTDEHSLVQVNGERVFRGGHGGKTLMLDLSRYIKEGKNELIVQVDNGNLGTAFYAAAIVLDRDNGQQVYPSNNEWLCMSDFDKYWNHKKEIKGQWQACRELAPYGQAKYTRGEVEAVYKSLNLMPKNQQALRSTAAQNLIYEGEHLILRQSQTKEQAQYYAEDRPLWSVNSSMRRARGLKLLVEGDASSALLVVTLRGRGEKDYILPIDFKGEKEVLIPCGEVALSDKSWSWRASVKHFDYKDISSLRLGFGRVPANTKPQIKIKKLELVEEKPVQLKGIEILAGNQILQINSSVQTGQYLWYKGGDEVGVYDLNWNKLREIKINAEAFKLAQAQHDFSIRTLGASPYIEAQFFVKEKL